MSTNTFRIKKEQKGGSVFSKLENLLKLDAAFQSGIPVRFVPHILFVAFIGLFYIGNSHYAEKNVRKIDALEKEVEDLRADYTTLKADYMFAGKQSEVAKNIARKGITESLRPPEKIVINSEH
ncbi:FtsL-like putative cell division protein [Fulvivirga sp.]|jgi:hypothetical protein|uniref:FtsL-like putative cell division protein n=1 Tax=Fulvivirga sp. TaxID=1931237 RepID=UPI0032EC87AF